MLERSDIDRLTRTLDTNGPEDNVALAEEGDAAALVALASYPRTHAEALTVIGQRILAEGGDVGVDFSSNREHSPSIVEDLDRLLVVHPAAPGPLRDAVLNRHQGDAFFVLSAACHPQATLAALERAADWPAASPLHDRMWLTLLDPARVPALAKACASKYVLELVRRAYPGLAVEHVPAPPAGIAPRPGVTYFELALAGPCAQGLQDTREFGVYVPDGIPGAALELAVLVAP